MTTSGFRSTAVVAFAAAITALSATACTTSLERLPLPSPSIGSDTYTVKATFSNALNLPTRAKVKMNGADVGEVESMTARDYTAIVTLRIESGVVLPEGTTAELRSATPMGDVFVSVKPPERSAPGVAPLGDGATIPIASTSAAATIEEVLTRASLLVNGGAVQNVTKLVNNLGEAVGGRGDRLASMIEETRRLVSNLAARSDQLRGVLAQMGTLSATVAQQQSTLDDTLAAAGPALEVVADNTRDIVDLVGKINRITQQIARFPSVNGTNDRSLMASINLLAEGMNAGAVNPDANLDSLNTVIGIILKITDGGSAHIDADLAQIAVGTGPDPNFPGDSQSKVPDVTDWTNFIGSLTYNLNKLRERIGPVR